MEAQVKIDRIANVLTISITYEVAGDDELRQLLEELPSNISNKLSKLLEE
jgi:hypothetical protein